MFYQYIIFIFMLFLSDGQAGEVLKLSDKVMLSLPRYKVSLTSPTTSRQASKG
jgi:hypothetical protein